MRKKFLGIEENILLAGETLLDPWLKKLAFSDANSADSTARVLTNEASNQTQAETLTESTAPNPELETLQVGNSGGNGGLWQFLDQRVADTSLSHLSSTEAITEMQQYLRVITISRKDAWCFTLLEEKCFSLSYFE